MLRFAFFVKAVWFAIEAVENILDFATNTVCCFIALLEIEKLVLSILLIQTLLLVRFVRNNHEYRI